MKIVWHPRYSITGASSRLRVFALHEALKNREEITSRLHGDPADADVTVIQKMDSGSARIFARRAKGMVIYDYDDRSAYPTLRALRDCVSVFTCDTEGHRQESQEFWKPRECRTLPDAIDYFPEKPLSPNESTTAIWFGCYLNYSSAKWMGDALRKRDVHVRLYCEPNQLKHEGGQAWSYETFPDELRRAGVAFLSHSVGDTEKSANKMIAAVMFGVPCIVSDTPAYGNLARECGLDWAVVRNEEELLSAYRRLMNPSERRIYLDAIQPVVWDRFHASKIADRFLEIVNAYR